MKNVLSGPKFANPAPAKKVLPCHMCDTDVICVDCHLLITELEIPTLARLISKRRESLNEEIDRGFFGYGNQGQASEPFVIAMGPHMTIYAAVSPCDSLIVVIGGTLESPVRIGEIR